MTRVRKSQAGIKQAVPLFAVQDMEVSLRYYVDGLGFKMSRKWVEDGEVRWCWLRAGEAAIMLQAFADSGSSEAVSRGGVGEGVTVFFICDDALVFYREVKSRGLDASPPFVGNGMWVTNLTDPDGYRLAFESETDSPEDTQFSEALA